ncbi:Serine/threonine-protein kinase PrkC [Caulifigura coniformis]|uniref:Serine/threonine-protein kinase PrkC n=1 Tax=Caulifigura coniformis TaxID=2527983 RepID=A0A517SFV9_9PLAN|nr:serine/threonine protein kinase [Caulifigura coniformis]QDT55012.1 Serine/threonine-protein kinase PrkC [Caulifigura coniformis]
MPAAHDPAAITADGETLRQDVSAIERSQSLSRLSGTAPGVAPGYDIVRCLGEGSFGSVWLATETRTGRQVAIKFYTHQHGLDWSLLSREVEKLAVLYTSRNIVGLLDVGWDRDPPYFVMEYLEQGPLSRRLAAGALPAAEAVRIARDMLSALVHAHNSGILHCDLKPANILIDSGGATRLGDFGQSRLSTEQTPALGTLYYMAPEQAVLDGVPDARWDVYALGALLYHMLTGVPPYRTPENEQRLQAANSLEERLATYRRILSESPQPGAHRRRPGVDSRLADLVDSCLQRDPLKRLSNAQVALDLLEERDNVLAKRPLIALGIIGPLLFLATLVAVAARAIPKAEKAAESSLLDRALATDLLTVDILAKSVQQEFDIRQKELEDITDRLIKSVDGKSHLRDDLKDFLGGWTRTVSERLKSQQRTEDDSIFVVDASGLQVYRTPHDETVGQNFAYRDYFHGLGRELPPGQASEVRPRKTSGISLAYRSQSSKEYKVSVAVPIWNTQRTEVLGVIARSIPLSDLLTQWESSIAKTASNSRDRFLALVDMRESPAYLLDHPWMTEQESRDLEDEKLKERLVLSQEQREAVEKLIPSSRYDDPIARTDERYAGPWLAAFAPVGKTGWYAIVQERRSSAVGPVQNLRQVFVQYGAGALVAMTAVFALLGTLLWRASR